MLKISKGPIFNFMDFRVKSMYEHAIKITSLDLDIVSATEYLEQAIEFRVFFNTWYGEHSYEYRLANAIVILLRMLRNTQSEALSLKEWVKEQPIRRTWFNKLENALMPMSESSS